ncbi:HAD-IA family hydrolase [Motilibacter deserti]|uniref:HAD-IA family hydrolase n=1 Tax=Motilibacter deserti TaxID=2714956 RepID=A0ABX0GU20_9ACTN|nr:HAD-IA family hydrolase [Motilibacter deserti]NHC13154.1 HAD-IA family hydrolase [Motilibacter deserti]
MRLEVDALLFDIDGTLVDSTPVVERTWRTWAGRRGLDAEEILRVCHGRRSEDTIADLLPVGERAAATVELEELELADLDDVVALPATRVLLPRLPTDRWAAVTSGSQRLMRARLAAAGLPVPAVLVGAEDVSVGKPDPEGYLKAAAALGVDVSRCLVVEDAPAGLAAGRAAGARTLGVATSHEPGALRSADVVVADLTAVSVEATTGGLAVTVSRSTSEPAG